MGGLSVLATPSVYGVVTNNAEAVFPVSTTTAPDGTYTLTLYKNVDLLPANTSYDLNLGGRAHLTLVVTGAGTVEAMQVSSAPLPSTAIPESQVTGLVGDLAGKVTSVTAADGTIVVGGTAAAPTIRATGGGGAVTSVAGRDGAVVLANTDVSGLGSASTHPATDFDAAGLATAAQAAAIAASAQRASNLSDLSSAATARTNLGLGTAATHATGDYDATGAAAAAQAAAIQRANHTGTQLLATISDAGTAASHAATDFDAAGAAAAKMANPMSAVGDLIVGGVAGAPGGYAAGATGLVLTANGVGVAPTWQAAAGGGVSSLTGTAAQITVSASTGAVTLSLPNPLTTPGVLNVSANGAASTPAEALTGTWFTGGSATTTKPQLLIEPAGTSSTQWSTAGTGLGINAPSGFTGVLIEAQIAHAPVFRVSANSSLLIGIAGVAGGSIATSQEAFTLNGPGATYLTMDSRGAQTGSFIAGVATATAAQEFASVIAKAQTLTITSGFAAERFSQFPQPTITAGSALTVTDAATVAIANAPAAAGSAVITNAYALWVQAGRVRIQGLSAFVASDKYVVIDSNGNLHASAVGPAS